jgi:hypothetical protein
MYKTENETAVIRWNYGDAALGACKETIQGGNHFRYWVQNGDKANRCVLSRLFTCYIITHFSSGAIFMALSYELPVARKLFDPIWFWLLLMYSVQSNTI